MASPPRRWGWHRLDDEWADRIVRGSGVGRGDLVLDIGAGTGALTAPLIAAGARVIAFETHPGRADELRARFGSHIGRQLAVVRADAADLRLPRRPFHVVANPPFGVTAALLRRLLHPGSRMVAGHLIVQEAAARRWAAGDVPATARWRAEFDVSLGSKLPRGAFAPPPRVDARLLVLRRRSGVAVTRR